MVGLRETCLFWLGGGNGQIPLHKDVHNVQTGCSVEEDLSGCDNGGTADWEGERTLWTLVGFGAPKTLEGAPEKGSERF